MFAYKNKKDIPSYNFYLSAYNSLDLLSKTKDKVTSKNTPDNLLTDGVHTWFAGFCDFFVSDDETIRKKAKALYPLFGIPTAIYSVEEFNSILSLILTGPAEDWSIFWGMISYDMQNAERSADLGVPGVTAKRYIQTHYYLDFFDSIIEVQTPETVELILFKSGTNALSDPSFSEQSAVIKRSLAIFGDDEDQKGAFDYHQIIGSPETAVARRWLFNDIHIALQYDNRINKYILDLVFNKNLIR